MKRLIQFGLVLAATVPLCAQATPLGAKAGKWKTTITTTMSGLPKDNVPKISKEDLAKLPPERRAMVERMLAMRAGKPVSMTREGCMKQSDNMDKLMMSDPNRPNCKRKIISKTATSVEVEITCTGTHATKGHIKIKALSPKEIVSTADVSGEGGFKLHAVTKAHWVSNTCPKVAKR